MKPSIGSITLAIVFIIGLDLWLRGCSCVGTAVTFESPVKVVGVVTDKDTSRPVAGARVADNVYGGNDGRPCRESWTDNAGRYVLTTWREEHNIMVSAPDYMPQLQTLKTVNSKTIQTEPQIVMNIAIRKK